MRKELLEQLTVEGSRKSPVPEHLIDLDLVQGNSFPKAKPINDGAPWRPWCQGVRCAVFMSWDFNFTCLHFAYILAHSIMQIFHEKSPIAYSCSMVGRTHIDRIYSELVYGLVYSKHWPELFPNFWWGSSGPAFRSNDPNYCVDSTVSFALPHCSDPGPRVR